MKKDLLTRDGGAAVPGRGWLLKAALACATLMLCAAGPAAAPVSLSLQDERQGAYRLEGHFLVDASPEAAWNVLTDYEGIAQFVPSILRSRIRERGEDSLLLDQEARARVFLFSREVRVLLRVREAPPRAIYFDDVGRMDFEFYEGSWRLERVGEGIRIGYSLHAKRKFAAPNFVAKGVFKSNAEKLLEQVRSEILRRDAALGERLTRAPAPAGPGAPRAQ